MKTKKEIRKAYKQCEKARTDSVYGCPLCFEGIPEKAFCSACTFRETLKWVMNGKMGK